MKSRQKNDETLKLSLELLKRIPKSHKITAKELHSQLMNAGFERDLRTIQRQLKSLSETFDIELDDRSKPYGYKWKSESVGFSLPMLSEQESILLTLAEEYLSNLLPNNLMRSMHGFFEQAKYKLDQDDKNSGREWINKVKIVSASQPLLPPTINKQIFSSVSQALYENKYLNISYENSQGYVSKSRVMPFGLAQQDVRLYLVCRYENYDDERNLALHRIKKAEVSTLTFTRPAKFNFKKYIQDGRFGFGDGKEIKLSFCISKDAGFHLNETPLSEDQTIKQQESHYQVTTTVVDSDMLDGWLRSFGESLWGIKKQDI